MRERAYLPHRLAKRPRATAAETDPDIARRIVTLEESIGSPAAAVFETARIELGFVASVHGQSIFPVRLAVIVNDCEGSHTTEYTVSGPDQAAHTRLSTKLVDALARVAQSTLDLSPCSEESEAHGLEVLERGDLVVEVKPCSGTGGGAVSLR